MDLKHFFAVLRGRSRQFFGRSEPRAGAAFYGGAPATAGTFRKAKMKSLALVSCIM